MASIRMTVQYRGLSIRKPAWAVDLQDMPTDKAIAVRSQGHLRARQREQRLCDPIRSMAEKIALRDKVPGDATYAHGFDALDVGLGGLGAFGGVALAKGCGYGTGVHHGVLEDGPAGVLVDALDMLGDAEAETLVRLRHEVGNVDAGGACGVESLSDAVDEQVGDEAGVQRPWAKSDEVGARDGLKRFRQCRRDCWFERDLGNALRLVLILVSPQTKEPSSMRATRMAFAEVAGRMRPRIARTSLASLMAWAKSPVISARAAIKRLPKLWPPSSPSERKRWRHDQPTTLHTLGGHLARQTGNALPCNR